ncbi:hypothetical protein [Flindersiella endophytica]
MGGEKPVRSRGWTAVLFVVVIEIAVLGAVGIYASVAGHPTFESRAWLNRALTPAPTPSDSAKPPDTGKQPANAKPVELDPCELMRTQDINMTLGTRFQPTRASAGPGGNVGILSGEEGWWTSCLYEDYPQRTEGLEVLVFTGPRLSALEPTKDEDPRAVPGLGEEAWVTKDESESTLILEVRTASAFLSLTEYLEDTPADTEERRLTTLARELVGRLPAKPRITPMRLGDTCAAIPLDGGEDFLGVDLVGGRQLLTPGSDTTCTFTGYYGAMLEVTVFVEGSVDGERAFFRGEGKRVAGVGDEAYVYYDELNGPIFFVRDGDLAFSVIYYTDEEPSDETEPTAAELDLLKSLVADGDVITG